MRAGKNQTEGMEYTICVPIVVGCKGGARGDRVVLSSLDSAAFLACLAQAKPSTNESDLSRQV